jgi:hypothetical protein
VERTESVQNKTLSKLFGSKRHRLAARRKLHTEALNDLYYLLSIIKVFKSVKIILSCICFWLQTMYRLDIVFIDHFNTQLVTRVNYTAIANLHILQSQSSLVVSWQRIYNSLALTTHSKCHCTTAHMKSSLHCRVSANPLPSLLNHSIAILRDSVN